MKAITWHLIVVVIAFFGESAADWRPGQAFAFF
jgi:hypothetical protein